MDYNEFLATKQLYVKANGPEVEPDTMHKMLFPFQRDLTKWSIRKGRAAIFADTGLGKTFMQLEWARLIGNRSLIVAPLSVARQTTREARKLNQIIHYTRDGHDINDGINITNYEMIEQFDPDDFDAVVLDESSILKSLNGKTRQKLIEMFQFTPYRLACTATPAPNDIAEIANHAEFLGIMTRNDMLATFFVHDDNGWRLKGHAKDPFFKWLASWSMSVRLPSDIGYDDTGYILPPLTIKPIFVESEYKPEGQLFFTDLKGIQDRHAVRKATLQARVERAAKIVNDSDEQWIVWCGLNDESKKLASLIPDAVEVTGSDSTDEKSAAIELFQDGGTRVLITKAKIAGFGMNLQNAHKMAFVGLSDSWEAYYQCIRRSYRFGQTEPVDVSIIISEAEEAIYQNVMRKESEALEMSQQLIANVQQFSKKELYNVHVESWKYQEDVQRADEWTMYLGDSAQRIKEIADNSIGMSVFSPPFMSLYTYSPTERDLGNSASGDEFFQHFGYVIDDLLRVTMPGRNCCVHVADVPAMLVRDGYIGLKDFPGMTIKAFEDRGWVFYGRVTIDKNPQVQALRTKAKGLVFRQLEKDSAWSRPAVADQILIFKKPGDNVVPVEPDVSREEWILWARAVWYGADYTPGTYTFTGGDSKQGHGIAGQGIRETDTLQYTTARSEDDERHICPLQLGTIERCIRLWSNKGETVLSPFAGIGSEGHVALTHGRKFIGIELKPGYWKVAVDNLRRATEKRDELSLFDMMAQNAAD